MRRFFCDTCGKEITTEEKRYNIALFNRATKKQKTILHLCETDVKKVRNMKYIPKKNCRVRKIPTFYNVVESHCGKDKSLYIITDWNIDQLQSINTKDPTKLYLEDGRRYFTKEYVLALVDSKNIEGDIHLMHYTQLLFKKQTNDEKAKYETKYHNNVGFNKSDAKFMSAMARESFNKGIESLSANQIDTVRKRFTKYAEQVANILNGDL